MKKLSFLVILGLLLTAAPIVKAGDTAVQAPGNFTLNKGDKATVTNYLNMKIELRDITELQLETYPPIIKKSALIHVETEGGCNLTVDSRYPQEMNATPPCLGMPSFYSDYSLAEGGTVTALGLTIKATSVASSSATFDIKFTANGTPQDPIVIGGGNEGTVTICSMPNTCSGSSSNGSSDDSTNTENDNPTQTTPSYSGSADNPSTMLELDPEEEVQSINKTNATDSVYNIVTKKKTHLLYFIPVKIKTTYLVDVKSGITKVKRAWWRFLTNS